MYGDKEIIGGYSADGKPLIVWRPYFTEAEGYVKHAEKFLIHENQIVREYAQRLIDNCIQLVKLQISIEEFEANIPLIEHEDLKQLNHMRFSVINNYDLEKYRDTPSKYKDQG